MSAMVEQYYTVREIAAALNVSSRAVQKRAGRNAWAHVEFTGRGGRIKKYLLSSLPTDVQEALALHRAVTAYSSRASSADDEPAASAPPPAVTDPAALPAPSTLTKWQRDTMDARCAILNLVDDIAAQASVRRAVAKVVLMAQAGSLPPHIQALVSIANARAVDDETLSERTIYRWRSLRRRGVTALAPTGTPSDVPPWAPFFLKLYKKPEKPSVADVLEGLPDILPPGVESPSQSQCYRFLSKMSAIDREKGRRAGNDLRSIMPFRRRGTDELLPLDVVTTDGHSFKSRVAHPIHGKPFKPEVCAVVDVATRKALGWSAGLSESASTVADSLRHAIQHAGIPAMLYSDPGAGNTAYVNSHPSYGRYARMGITFTTGMPGRTQARGLIERFQRSCWIRAAKRLPTYCGTDMDSDTLYKRTRLVDAEVRKNGTSNRVPPWDAFIRFCQEAAIDAYNNRPHSGLPKITDETGRRHMSPNECWDMWIDRGWQPERVTDAELADMWRPRVTKPTHRGEVRLFGNIYYHGDLGHYHGSQVYVEYEPQDPSSVYVRDLDERLICTARWNANRSSYQPISAIEAAADQRAKRRLELVNRKRDEIEMERRGAVTIEAELSPALIEARKRLEEEMARAPQDNDIEIPDNDAARWRLWQRLDRSRSAGDTLPDHLERFWAAFQTTRVWQTFHEIERDLSQANEA